MPRSRPSPHGAHGPVVGFDLDLTLVDSTAGIARTMRATLAAERVGGLGPGGPTDEAMRAMIGLPLETSIALLAPDADVARVAARYRQLYPELGVPGTVLLPGVAAAIRAVRTAGGRVLVVSAKTTSAVHRVLAHVGLDPVQGGPLAPDLVAGDLFAGQKGLRLREAGAHAYVGDHPGDMEAARVAGAAAVAVLTGGADEPALRAAGADVVLADLTRLPAWLDAWWSATDRRAPGPALDDEPGERDGEADGAEQRERGEHAGR